MHDQIPATVTQRGKTAMEYAKDEGHSEVIALLDQ